MVSLQNGHTQNKLRKCRVNLVIGSVPGICLIRQQPQVFLRKKILFIDTWSELTSNIKTMCSMVVEVMVLQKPVRKTNTANFSYRYQVHQRI